MEPGETLVLDIEKDAKLSEYISRGSAWAYLKFNPACYAVVHYVSRLNKSVAVCHAF